MSRYTISGIKAEIKQANAHITLLFEQLNNEKMIFSYNQRALARFKEENELEKELQAIEGSLEERKKALHEKHDLFNQKRDVSDLAPDYAQLESKELHLGIEHTPASIVALYDRLLSQVKSLLTEIDNTIAQQKRVAEAGNLKEQQRALIKEFDEKCSEFSHQVDQIVKDSDSTTGSIEEKKEILSKCQNMIEELHGRTSELQEPYVKLAELKSQHKTRHTIEGIESQIKKAKSHLANLSAQHEINTRIDSYNQKALARVKEQAELEKSLQNIEGSHEERRNILFEKQALFTKKRDLSDLAPEYEELEREDLHLGIEHSPSSIVALYYGLLEHIKALLSEIDAAIAHEKGLEVDETQILEFRSTFETFDKDKSKTLQYYELKACLAAMGENYSDDECKAIIAKYVTNKGSPDLDFDGYVRFMNDHLSKAETAETTKEAFLALASNQGYISEAQIDMYFRGESGEYLKSTLPKTENGYDFSAWVDQLRIE
jgi:actinin alpha